MPKKTRKEKVMSQERRIQFLLKQTSNQPVEKVEAVSESTVTPVQTETLTTEASYFRQDLIKSLVLVAIVITLEIFVYFVTINRYLVR